MDSSCPVCRNESELWRPQVIDPQSYENFDIYRCATCGLGHTQPRPQDMRPYYGTQYVGGRHGLAASYCDRRRVAICGRITKGTNLLRLLDVGCGDGTFMQAMQRRGFEVAGVERYSGIAKETSGAAVFDDIEDAVRLAPYDLVTFWHVLEHLPDPTDALNSVNAITHCNSVLVIAVPNSKSFAALLMGNAWLHWDVPRHLFHFDSSSLRSTLHRCGWEMRRQPASEFEYDLMGWSVSLLNLLGFERNLLFKMLTGRVTTTSWIRRRVAFCIGTAFSALVCVPVYLAGRLGRGGTLVVTATKQGCINNV